MKRILLLANALLFLMCGCDRRPLPVKEAEAAMERNVEDVVNFDTSGVRVIRSVVNRITTLSNDVEQVRLLNLYADKLMSADLSGKGYYQQNRCMRFISDMVWDEIVSGLFASHVELTRIYDMRFRLVEWMRAQLIRIGPRRKIDPHHWNSPVESRKHTDWMSAYTQLYDNMNAFTT